jgi:phospholipid/cholesterol/gamma-HCH transport system ATP-binding protein
MDIGDNIMYLYQGLKLWEGTNAEILDAETPELKDVLFSNALVRSLKGI